MKSLGTRRRRHGGHLEYQYQDIEVFGCTSLLTMPPKLNVHNFPRPPLLEKTPRHLQIKWNNQLIADTKDAYWALETTHPPSNIINPPARPAHNVAIVPIFKIHLKASAGP